MAKCSIPVNPRGGKASGVRGSLLTFNDDPFLSDGQDFYDFYDDGLVVIQDGMILDAGPYSEVAQRYDGMLKEEDVDRYADSVVMPGFIDCHTHYVQAPMIGSYGDTLLDWLNRYTYPTETKFSDKDFAARVAEEFFRQILSRGTTTANVFATTFEESVDAFFEESERLNTRMICGKVLQDRNLPEGLRDRDAAGSVEMSERLLEKWHRRGRQLYAVVPRFAPTSTPHQLQLAGELYQRHVGEGVYLHSHLDEAQSEIDWVRELFPDSRNYTDVYRSFGLLGPRTVMAHCCIMEEEEWQTLHDYGCGAVHCPSSNLFLGDGEFRLREAKKSGRQVNVGIGTDVGGGTSFSVLSQLGEAYKVGMLDDYSLSALRGFYLATRGGAATLCLEDKIGSLAPGYEADIAVLDMKATDFVEWRLGFTSDIIEKLFVVMTLSPESVNRATYVAGRKVFERNQARGLD